MKPGTTLEDLERANLDCIVNRIASRGIYHGLAANENEMFYLRVIDSEVNALCDFDVHESNHGRGLCREELSNNDKDEMRQEKREQLESLRDAGRLTYRRQGEGFGYLTLTPSEWQKVILNQISRADEYESSLDGIGDTDAAVARGNKRLLTAKSGGEPIAMWFKNESVSA